MCSRCGVVCLRSEMWKDAEGMLNCPDEGQGLDQVTLSRMLSQEAARPKRTVVPQDGFATDHEDDPDPTTGAPVPFNPDVRLV